MGSKLSIRHKRERIYGDAYQNHKTLSKMVTALLEQHYQIDLPHDLPGHMMALIMTLVKANRSATPLAFNPDNYVDGMAYFQIAEEVDDRNPKNKNRRKKHGRS